MVVLGSFVKWSELEVLWCGIRGDMQTPLQFSVLIGHVQPFGVRCGLCGAGWCRVQGRSSRAGISEGRTQRSMTSILEATIRR